MLDMESSKYVDFPLNLESEKLSTNKQPLSEGNVALKNWSYCERVLRQTDAHIYVIYSGMTKSKRIWILDS